MLEQRHKLLAFSAVALMAVSVSLYFLTKEDAKPSVDREIFKIPDSEQIDKIILQSARQSVTLTFESKRWRVNGQYDADDQMIKVLLATLLQAEPRRPVAVSMKDSVVQSLAQSGTHVTLSTSGQDVMKFVAGGNAMKTEAWFMKDGDVQPYVIIIPGYRVYVSGILEMPESDWRNKRIFDFNWRNFKSLSARYTKEPKEGFEVEMRERLPTIRNMAEVDTAKLNSYIDAVSLLFASRFVSPGERRIDSLALTAPVVRIEVKDIGDRSYVLELFTPQHADAEVYCRMGDGQIVAVDKNTISEIVRRRGYFNAIQNSNDRIK